MSAVVLDMRDETEPARWKMEEAMMAVGEAVMRWLSVSWREEHQLTRLQQEKSQRSGDMRGDHLEMMTARNLARTDTWQVASQ